MASFEVCVRSTKKEYNTVYIRVIHNGNPNYIKTSLSANRKQLKGLIVKDTLIRVQLASEIKKYIERLNTIDIKYWDIHKVIEFLTMENTDISFSKFAETYIKKLSSENRDSSANSYKCAVSNLKKFLDKENIMFSDITVKNITKWIESLKRTKDVKKKYPILIKTLFKAGLIEYNDYENGVLLIKHQPFIKVEIPKSETAVKRSLDRKEIRKILFFDCEKSIKEIKTPLAKDVAKLVLFLAGINTIDLYYLEKTDLKNWKLCYNRRKTKDRREDKSYIEISVPEELKPIFEKYKGEKRLFNFSENYHSSQQFNKTVNTGLKDISDILEFENDITTYYFRHSWANIAKNKFKASDETLAFCLNHSSAHKVTGRYFTKDFSPIDNLNSKIINYLTKRNIKPFRKKQNSIKNAVTN